MHLILFLTFISLPQVEADDFTKYVNGNLFARLSLQDLKTRGIEKFGESWLAPEQVIWGDALVSSEQVAEHLSFQEAQYHCSQMGEGARLPLLAEFIKLRTELGAIASENFSYHTEDSAENCSKDAVYFDIDDLNRLKSKRFKKTYVPQVLPNLKNEFWTTTTVRGYPNLRYVFNGTDATFSVKNISFSASQAAVRCVFKVN